MNAFEKIIAILVACVLLFLYPLYSLAIKTDTVVKTYVDDQTATLVDSIRNSGKLTYDMYTTYLKKLSTTDNLYDISITHQHATYYPIYDDNNNATGEVNLQYSNTYEDDILNELYFGSGIYSFSEGDYVSVKLVNTNRTLADIMAGAILSKPKIGNSIYVSYGGRIRDEN